MNLLVLLVNLRNARTEDARVERDLRRDVVEVGLVELAFDELIELLGAILQVPVAARRYEGRLGPILDELCSKGVTATLNNIEGEAVAHHRDGTRVTGDPEPN